VSPASVDFGRIHIGRSPEAKIRLENCGERPLSIRSTQLVDTPPTFALISALENASLAPGDSRTIRVRFAPLDTAHEAGTVRIDSDAGDVFIELSGSGRDRRAVIDCGLLHLETNYCMAQTEYVLVGGHDFDALRSSVEGINYQKGKLYGTWHAGELFHVFEDHFYIETIRAAGFGEEWVYGFAVTEDDLLVVSSSLFDIDPVTGALIELPRLLLYERSTGALINEFPESSRINGLSCFTNPS
jgi:hypothetical protein